ncbi:hypothetical protein XENOCAPTIV_027377 [Xenoophorus captivus]|uniref:Uncharacterized protein n=1 Tax=Xenoophorus captivus TaxID=1517983 RepID=A0ABV0S1P8_9TELE
MVNRLGEGGCSNSCAFIWEVASQEVRSYPVSCLCRKKVNALYFEKLQKSSYRSLMLKSMAVGPNNSITVFCLLVPFSLFGQEVVKDHETTGCSCDLRKQ